MWELPMFPIIIRHQIVINIPTFLLAPLCEGLVFFFPLSPEVNEMFGVHLSIKTKGQEKTNKMIRAFRTEANPSVCKHTLDCGVLAPRRLRPRVCRLRHLLSTNIILKQAQAAGQISRRWEKGYSSPGRVLNCLQKGRGGEREKLPRVHNVYFHFFCFMKYLDPKGPDVHPALPANWAQKE